MTNGNEQVIRLLTDLKESLEREIHEFRDEVKTRFDTQAARLDRHAALMQTGNRWTSRINDWSEKIDAALEQKDKQIGDILERLRKLEGSRGQGMNDSGVQ